jgi:hypothetical protein
VTMMGSVHDQNNATNSAVCDAKKKPSPTQLPFC